MIKKLSLIFGTRPEAIKLSPLVRALREHPDFEPHVCVTAQHRQMLDQVLEVFEVVPDVDLDLMRPDQSLADLTARAVTAVSGYLREHRPDMVIVQGDTTTTFCAALAAFYQQIPVAHVEAGLRTGDRHAPFPEEINRVMTSSLADLHFAPTERARQNLLAEGIPAKRVHVTGNTVIDALLFAVDEVRARPPAIPGLPAEVLARHPHQPAPLPPDTSITSNDQSSINGKAPMECGAPAPLFPAGPDATPAPLVLITGHRRESFGEGFENICRAIAELADRYPAGDFVYPVHLNPNVREPVRRILGGRPNVHLLEPLPYLPFVHLMDRCTLILTDSGGIQEEAPSLGKPVLVMRDTTERPEGVAAGCAILAGTSQRAIVHHVTELLIDGDEYTSIADMPNPYGDGTASARILSLLNVAVGRVNTTDEI